MVQKTRKRAIFGTGISLAAFAAAYAGISGTGDGLRRMALGEAIAQASPPAGATLQAPAGGDASLQNLFVTTSDKMMPSVVNVFTTKRVRARPMPRFPMDPWGGLFGDLPDALEGSAPEPRGGASTPMSLGTGFIIEADGGAGLILTNNHVIAGADEVKVKFTESDDEKEVPAQVVGRDPELDIALLKVKTDRKLQPVALGDSERLKVGEWIAAVGNPFGHGHSVSHGIVSAKERTLPGGFGKYLQVDAPINPGNSGGPLVNLAGEVIGINNAIDARGPGIGFAIPINAVKALLPQLKSSGRVERGYLGLSIMPINPKLARALKVDVPEGTPIVADVGSGTPAARAGIEPYDVISKLDGRPVKSAEQAAELIMGVPVGKTLTAEIIRGGKPLKLEVKVGKRPELARS